MIQIYLCDDEETVLHQIKTALEWKIFVEDYDMEVSCAARCARDLLEAAREGSRSVYFLDVDLRDGEWDGFRLGRELRRRDPHATLVYITSYGDLAWRTFQYHLEAFDYIVKDPEGLEEAVCRCLEAVHARFQVERRDPEEVLTLREGDRVRLDLSDPVMARVNLALTKMWTEWDHLKGFWDFALWLRLVLHVPSSCLNLQSTESGDF